MNTHDWVWRMPPSHLSLGDNDVHVWRASLDLPMDEIAPLHATLAPDEQARAAQFQFERDRRRFAVGRGVLRTILARYTGIAPECIEFCYSTTGKPALAPSPGSAALFFNVAHSHELALYAVGRHTLGVDVEHIRPLHNAAQLARRICSPAEQAELATLPRAEHEGALLRCWTRKEAYIKACGAGLAYPLPTIDVGLARREHAPRLRIAGDRSETAWWSLHDVDAAPGYVSALVVEGVPSHITCWQWASSWYREEIT
jgi:4'-phosphopantetheinyl transferase